jgi:uncharacterized protein YdhG (YjbR/CyaY superfamily)
VSDTQKSTKRTSATAKRSATLSDEERLALKEHVQELKAERRRGSRADKGEEERAVLAKIAEMEKPDRIMAERIHEVIKASAPTLSAKLWYGMPAYARDGKVVCFFQSAQKFKSRYATFGFSDQAKLDEGSMWPTAFALANLDDDTEARIAALVRKAVG